jgi:L-iditol 2-dehydrogenase
MSFDSTWVEHVLSQKPAVGRKWRADFSDEQRKEFDARGAHLRRYCYSIAIDPLARGLVTLNGIATHGFSLEECDKAIRIANSPNSIRCC